MTKLGQYLQVNERIRIVNRLSVLEWIPEEVIIQKKSKNRINVPTNSFIGKMSLKPACKVVDRVDKGRVLKAIKMTNCLKTKQDWLKQSVNPPTINLGNSSKQVGKDLVDLISVLEDSVRKFKHKLIELEKKLK